ncbi:MAG: GvpL/GvpF family gas vesicle protein [Longimonas sp.]|uniref:GvpL/GvpF family gas vesicle protein n=1 Tax=Longimonas sp. TaxID=2039626 RepID=UPI003976D822
MPTHVSSLSVDADEALYFFCLVQTPPWPLDHEGMSGHSVRLLALDDTLTALVDVVKQDAWTGPEAEANMQSLEWVGTRATLHEEVVEAAMERGPVYPARFGTLYSSEVRLRETVRRHRSTINAFMEEVDGADEWALKVFVDRDQAAAAVAAPASDEDAPASGTAYLKQKQREQQARTTVDSWLHEVSDAMHTKLREAPVRNVEVLDPSRAVLAAPDEALAFNWALLVDRAQRDVLRTQVQQFEAEYGKRGLSFRLTGPWPPYTFRPLMPADE